MTIPVSPLTGGELFLVHYKNICSILCKITIEKSLAAWYNDYRSIL